MPIPSTPIRKEKIIYRLQVRYKNDKRDDVTYFLNKPKPKTIYVEDSPSMLIFKNSNESFVCLNEDVFSFSITEVKEKG